MLTFCAFLIILSVFVAFSLMIIVILWRVVMSISLSVHEVVILSFIMMRLTFSASHTK